MLLINFRIVGERRISKIPFNLKSIRRYLQNVNSKINEEELYNSLFFLILCVGDYSSYQFNNHFFWNGNQYYPKIEGWFENGL